MPSATRITGSDLTLGISYYYPENDNTKALSPDALKVFNSWAQSPAVPVRNW